MNNYPKEDHLKGPLVPPQGTRNIQNPPENGRIINSLEKLRIAVPPNDLVARTIVRGADAIGGVHGLKAILKHMNLYSGPLDARIEFNNPKSKNQVPNPIAEALVKFQYRYNAPHILSEDGLPLSDPHRVGIPTREYGMLGSVTLGILRDYAHRNNIPLPPSPGDTKFTSEKEFLDTYSPLIHELTEVFKLPPNYLFAIAKVESNLGTNPADYHGGNGVMQLTSAPMRDMAGDTAIPGKVDLRKIQIYQRLFQKIDIKKLKAISYGSGDQKNTLQKSLDDDVWDTLGVLCSGNTSPQEFRQAMQKVSSWERGIYKGLTYHTLNIIISAVYQDYIQEYRLPKGINDPIRASYLLAQAYNGGGDPNYSDKVKNVLLSINNPSGLLALLQSNSIEHKA